MYDEVLPASNYREVAVFEVQIGVPGGDFVLVDRESASVRAKVGVHRVVGYCLRLQVAVNRTGRSDW